MSFMPLVGACLVVLAASTVPPVARSGHRAQPGPAVASWHRTVAAIRRADYEGDREALRRLAGEFRLLPGDDRLAARLLYWQGFAWWRRALNGFNEPNADPDDLRRDLGQAASAFAEATSRDPRFHDAAIGSLSCLGLTGFLHRADPALVQGALAAMRPLAAALKVAAADNPRYIWVIGQQQWAAFPGTPKDEVEARRARVLAGYERGLELARQQSHLVTDPLEPTWGEAELQMSLAWSRLHQATPDLAAAADHGRAALALVPQWHYVRDILLPQIEREMAATGDDPHTAALRAHGQPPVEFVLQALDRHDLIIFDDGLHSAVEPFEFYVQLLEDARVRQRVSLVFLEVMSLAAQPAIDAYLDSPTPDLRVLERAFQDDFSGFGLRHQTYVDLLERIRAINGTLPPAQRIRVVGVNQPIYWEALHTRRDYDIFLDSLASRDYFMFDTIRGWMDDFQAGRKAFFLTNTRHAYIRLRARDGGLQRNCAAFFDLFHPGKAMSIRLDNAALEVVAPASSTTGRTAAGMETADHRWIRMEGGAWDRAFDRAGRRPMAIRLAGTPFGRARFVGNTMLDVRSDQTMADAYDALVFLAPIDTLRTSATPAFFYTPAFRRELTRRVILLEGHRLQEFLREEGVATIDALIDELGTARPARRSVVLDAAR